MVVEWNNDFELGIPSIDEQHKHLFSIINELDAANRGGKCGEVVEKIFLQLINYCNYHFTIEEQAMEKSQYHRLELHKSAHDLFVRNIHDYYYKNKKDDCFALSNAINFLNDWLIDHIMIEDREYLPVISDKFDQKK